MTRQDEVYIPPKRLRLLGIFCGSLLVLLVFFIELRVILASFGQQPSFFQTAFLALVMLCCIISIPYFVLFAIWALARLVFNLPAVILTPEGIVNHSIVYHVVIPWREIDQFVRVVPQLPPRPLLKQGLSTGILVDEQDVQRLYAQQQPVTKALLRLFSVLRPVNINTDVTEATPEEVWAQLERYVHETLCNTRIEFVSLRRSSSPRL
jgi:hypothetical protein